MYCEFCGSGPDCSVCDSREFGQISDTVSLMETTVGESDTRDGLLVLCVLAGSCVALALVSILLSWGK